MKNQKLNKISYNDLFKTTTMFYNNKAYEEEMDTEIKEKTNHLANELSGIDTKAGLQAYLLQEEESLENVTSLMGISSQRFIRMVSMIRKDKGYVFGTEWDLKSIRTNMLRNTILMDAICDLLLDGKNNPYFIETIPEYFLDNMVIDDETMLRLTNKSVLEQLVRKSVEGKYSNNIGDLIQKDIIVVLDNVCNKYGLEYKKEIKVPLLERSVNFVLEDESHPTIIMDVSYSVTTASGMGNKKKAAIDTRRLIDTYNVNHDKKITFINFLDGAGWIGRQADMREIHRCSDYVLNLKNLNTLEVIIEKHIIDF